MEMNFPFLFQLDLRFVWSSENRCPSNETLYFNSFENDLCSYNVQFSESKNMHAHDSGKSLWCFTSHWRRGSVINGITIPFIRSKLLG